MTPLDLGIAAALTLGIGGLAVHYQFLSARRDRLRTEANAFDDAEEPYNIQ